MKEKLVVWGAGGHARVVADIIRLQGNYEIVGFLDDVDPDRRGEEFCGAPILGGRDVLGPARQRGAGIAIVAIGDCSARLRLADVLRESGFSLATAVHPGAVVARDVQVGPGTVVAASAVINSASVLGENVIVNTCASVDHECVIGDAVHIGPGAHLGGRVRVGAAAWVGIGATVVDRVCIGSGAVIGAGSVVLHDIPGHVTAYGVPARVAAPARELGQRE